MNFLRFFPLTAFSCVWGVGEHVFVHVFTAASKEALKRS